MSISPESSSFAQAGDLRRASWLLGMWILALVGSLACGQREDPSVPFKSGAQDRSLPGIHDLGLQDYPQQHQIEISAGQGFVPLGMELLPGTPLRVELVARGQASPWGAADRRAGAGAPEPLRAQGAVILQLGAKTLVVGERAVLRVSERVRPKIAVNTKTSDQSLAFEVKIGWGEPTRAYNSQLASFGLAPGKGKLASILRTRDALGSHVISELSPGARVWVVPPKPASTPAADATAREGLQAWIGETPDGRLVPLARPMALCIDAGGQLNLRASTRSQAHQPPGVEVFEPLGTRAELIPMQAMDEIRTKSLAIEPRRFVKAGLSVQAGDLVRVEVRGENQLKGRAGDRVHNIGAQGGLRQVPGALRNGDRGWLVPGGRERGLYLRIGESIVELRGNDAFYAPEDGQIEIGVNQCFDGGDWPAYEDCRRRLKDWDLDLVVVLGVSAGD